MQNPPPSFPSLWELLSRENRPATFNAAIKEFLSDLERTDTQSALVAARQKAIHDRAVDQVCFDIDRPFLIGSYPRHTQIRPLRDKVAQLDIDSLLVLVSTTENKRRYWDINDGGAALLEDLRKALNGYQGLKAEIDKPSVTLTWGDMKMELTPAFYRKGGGYLIPGMQGGYGWISTDPKADSEILTTQNKACDDELVPLVKILKCWNRNWGNRFKSFEIETLATITAPYQGYRGYAYEIPYFFRRLLLWDGQDVPTASTAGNPILIRLDDTTRRILELSKSLTESAYEEVNRGNDAKAIEYYGTIFGKPFPGAKE